MQQPLLAPGCYLCNPKVAFMNFLALFAVIFVVFGLSFVLINIRHLVTGNEFRGTCASNNPMLTNKIGKCEVCGKSPDEDCKMPDMPQVK
jgi:hypothetical protein